MSELCSFEFALPLSACYFTAIPFQYSSEVIDHVKIQCQLIFTTSILITINLSLPFQEE